MILNLKNIDKSYIERDVLKNISLDVNRGDLIAIEGPSGSGKSTLLNLCGCLDSPDRGDILLSGINYNSLSDNELTALRNRKIGFVFQEHLLLPQCSVIENVLLPTIPNREDRCDRAVELLNSVGLGDRLHSSVGVLSSGESQRVAVARALINEPDILLADEPTGSLDKHNSENLAELFKKINRESGITIITVTHSDLFASHMDRRFLLSEGSLSEKK